MNIHPRLKTLFEAQASNYELVEAFSPTPNVTVAVFERDGRVKRSRFMKADIGLRFADVAPTVLASEGEPLDTVIQRFSDKYNLFLVSGIDYDATKQVVRFSESLDKSKILVPLVISDVALGWLGKVTIQLNNAEKTSTPVGIAVSAIANSRLALALVSKVFTDEDNNILTPGRDGLTLSFVQRVHEYLKSCGITSLTPKALGSARLVDLISDGISGIIVLKPKDTPGLFIRYEMSKVEEQA